MPPSINLVWTSKKPMFRFWMSRRPACSGDCVSKRGFEFAYDQSAPEQRLTVGTEDGAVVARMPRQHRSTSLNAEDGRGTRHHMTELRRVRVLMGDDGADSGAHNSKGLMCPKMEA